jgi:flagellar biosynthesis anti-sigma factor FlgM
MAMDVRNNLDGLKSLLGISPLAPPPDQHVKSETASASSSLAGDHATLSSAGSQAAQAVSDVRVDRVTAVQAALNNGTYQVPASAVAGKIIDAMLGGQPSEE